MNGTVRALLGAAIGAILTLLIHPVSRPFLAVVFWHSPAIDSDKPLSGSLSGANMPGRPQTLLEASVWMQAAAERIQRGTPLGRQELEDSNRVAEAAARVDPDNAFWKQMTAVFTENLGDGAKAKALWKRASECGSWNDFQTKRLQQMQGELAQRYGCWQSWQLGRVYKERSIAPASAIAEAARKRLASTALETDQGRLERYQMLRNGNLLRKGAQSLAVGMVGANLVNLAAEPVGFNTSATAKSRLTVRADYMNAMKRAGHTEEARQLNTIYRDNDSWTEYLNERNAVAKMQQFSLLAMSVATLPSVLLALSIVGLAVWVVGAMIPRFVGLQAALCFPGVLSVGLILALFTYALTLLPLAALATGLCASFLVFSPKNERTRKFELVGALFRFTTGFLAVTFIALMGMYLTFRTPPSVQVLSALDLQSTASLGAPALIGLSALVIDLLLLMAPFWAFANRMRTTVVLGMGLRSMGAIIAAGCLAGSIILCPLAVYADRALSVTMTELVTNEPVHYYLERE